HRLQLPRPRPEGTRREWPRPVLGAPPRRVRARLAPVAAADDEVDLRVRRQDETGLAVLREHDALALARVGGGRPCRSGGVAARSPPWRPGAACPSPSALGTARVRSRTSARRAARAASSRYRPATR